jgi:hypothetical protein
MTARLLAIGVLVGALVLPGAVANATPPGPTNDTISGATVISGYPYNTTENTSRATTDAGDAALNEFCGAPATDASVWFSHVATADVDVLLDASSSNYSAGILVASGSPGNLNVESCGPLSVGYHESNGNTYYIMVFDDQQDGSGNGGSMVLTGEAFPPPTISVTVNPIGHFNSQGIATLTGTATCANADFGEVDISLSQSVGRVATVRGFGFGELTCDGASHPWSADVYPDSGKFAGGKAVADVDGFVCGPASCTDDFVTKTVQLRK